MEERRQNNAEYKKLDIQRVTSKEISRLIYRFIYH